MKTISIEQIKKYTDSIPAKFENKDSVTAKELVVVKGIHIDNKISILKEFLTEEQCLDIAKRAIKIACDKLGSEITISEIYEKTIESRTFLQEIDNKNSPIYKIYMLNQIYKIGSVVVNNPIGCLIHTAFLLSDTWNGTNTKALLRMILEKIEPRPIIDFSASTIKNA